MPYTSIDSLLNATPVPVLAILTVLENAMTSLYGKKQGFYEDLSIFVLWIRCSSISVLLHVVACSDCDTV